MTTLLLISFVGCSKLKSAFFNKFANDEDSKPNEILKELNIQNEEKIADLGSGGGYYTFRFSEIVGKNGKIFAIDTDEKLLKNIESQAKEKEITNIEFILSKEDDSTLKEKSVDLIFVRNVFHHLPDPKKYFCKIKESLKTNGRVAIIDYKKTKTLSFASLTGHTTEPELINKVMEDCGFSLFKKLDFLPKQSFQIFQMKK